MFKKFLKGDLSLFKTYWLITIPICLAIGVFKQLFVTEPATLPAIIWALSILVTIPLTTIGIWNAANKYEGNKIWKWLVKAQCILTVLPFIFAIVVVIFEFFSKVVKSNLYIYKSNPYEITELYGIKIGDKLSDVLFKNEGIVADNERSDKDYLSFKDAFYNVNKQIPTRFFKTTNGLVKEIRIECQKDDVSTEIATIKCNDSGEVILDKFGTDVKILCRIINDEKKVKQRIYEVYKYRLRFGLEYNKVTMFQVSDVDSFISSSYYKDFGNCE